tara:strand:- start:3861 stop:5042 length:1182 start_codon:yes stop_codon:yes gene_type:complete
MKILNWIQKRIFPTIIALSALSVSASAAFYSVTGLSKLFAGASLQVLIMAGSLEFAKLVIASLLYQYWSQLNKLLRTYLSIATFILILITSAGIYGFLSGAYQETATKSGIIDKEISLLELKKGRFEENRTYYLSEKKELDKSITELRNGLSNNTIQYKDRETGQIITTTSSSQRKALEKQLTTAISSRNTISIKVETATDSISSLEINILDIQSNSEVASELGPLKYISELTNTPMSNVVNILMLIIIFVFDPLAISLVVAANFAFDRLKDGDEKVIEEEGEYDEDDEDDEWDEDHSMDMVMNEMVDGLDLEDILDDDEMDVYDKLQQEKVNTPINPTEEDIDKLRQHLENIENYKKEVKLEEEKVEEEKPQIKTLRYQPRNANRNTRIDRI